jgi:peptidoglycan hydrolase-like protein with peptidoglycan-binding domain
MPSPRALPAEAEMSMADRRQVQEALQRLDYYKGPVDGIFGPLTRAAIRRFQQQNIGADATGHLTADQANRLVTPR